MTEQEVVNLMESSKSEYEWNQNCDKVKAAFSIGGMRNYPGFWFSAIIKSGLANRVAAKFGGSADIKIVEFSVK